jgi:hypothetical protein
LFKQNETITLIEQIINKMKKIIVSLLFFTFLLSCKSRVIPNNNKIVDRELNYIPYYLKVYEADSLHIVGKYKQSQHLFDSLFKKYDPLNQESSQEYITFLKNKVFLNDFKNIKKVLKCAIQNFGFKVEYIAKDSILQRAVEKSKYKEKDLINFYNSYVKNLNLVYRYEIERMIANDQRVRMAKPVNHDDWVIVDKENAENIKLLIEKYGYPSIEKIGRYDYNSKSSHIDLLFLHAKKEVTESYILDLMLKSIKKGECTPSDYATVYDKYLFSTDKYGGKVLYGEFMSPKKSLEQAVIFPKKNDSIRKSIGLPNINYRRWRVKMLTGIDINN